MKNKKKIGLIIGSLLTLALLVTACGASKKSNTQTGDSANKDGELKTVKIGATSATAQLSENALLAQNLGYFDDELKKVGYKAEYVGFAQAGPAVNEAFAAGEIDYAIYADFAAIAAKSNKIDIKVVGLANQQMNYALLATQKSGIASWKDIEGKKLIVPTGTILYKYFTDECKKNGVNPQKVEQINSLSDAQTLLASGDADALVTAYGGALLYEGAGLGKVVDNSTDDLDEASGLVIAGRTKYIDENPKVAEALIKALNRSAEYIKGNKESAYEKMKTDATSVEMLEKVYSYDESFSYFSPAITDEYLGRAKSVYEFEKDNKLLGSEFELTDLYDNSYAEKIVNQ